ncbi:MAG: cytochrome c peroxidase [Syntrophobacteraceae bacterium]
MDKKLRACWMVLFLVVVQWVVPGDGLTAPKAVETVRGPAARLVLMEKLGKSIFLDKNLSAHNNQSCAACHAPSVGFTGPDSSINALGGIYMGSVDGLFANRKPPSTAYGGSSPVLHKQDDGTWCGGMFWDGRATGEKLGDPLAEQARAPFLNPPEQALPNAAVLVERVCKASYAGLFRTVWGKGACRDVNKAYEYIGRSVAAYERSKAVNPFSSKYDYFLEGKAALTPEEAKGLDLFNEKHKGNCTQCHPSAMDLRKRGPIVFTDFTYDNLGFPKNPLNPFYHEPGLNASGVHWVDLGLGGFLNSASEYGKHKVPTLRNVDKRPYPAFVKAYGHNGYFKSLESIVHFYNTRDVLPVCSEPLATGNMPGDNCWPAPEFPETVNKKELGNLGLSREEEACIVAFLETLSDGWKPDAAKTHATKHAKASGDSILRMKSTRWLSLNYAIGGEHRDYGRRFPVALWRNLVPKFCLRGDCNG